MEDANFRLSHVVAEQRDIIVHLKIENKNTRAENQRLRGMLIKEEPMDPIACVKEEPRSDDGESSVSIISLRKHQSHTDSPHSPSILKQAKQEIKIESQCMSTLCTQ